VWSSYVRRVDSLHLGRAGDRSGGTVALSLLGLAVSLPAFGLALAGPVVALSMVAVLVVAGWWAARTAADRRAAAADAELPTLLEAIARHLRTGGSLTEAIAAQAPLVPGDGWSMVAAAAPQVGVVAALDAWVEANDRPPVRLAAAALVLAAETGGSPARAVDGVAATLRARAAVAGELRALTSQARASAVVIAVSPVVFALLASATDPRTRAAFRTRTGTLLVLAGLALDAAGGGWMLHLCRLRGVRP
jgi:tight adherence protein B